ncbi:MAG: hypothetical protein HQ593_00540 [Candidatus Omnitrophica bacterium]|nr:hypothetical protein [Candidatus Omnitrophota bacterium]
MNSISKWLIGYMLYHGDTEFFSHAFGYRETNSRVFWMRKEMVRLLETAFGKEHFAHEYIQSEDVAEGPDCLGSVMKSDFLEDMLTFFFRESYKDGEHPEFTARIDEFFRENRRECLRLLIRNAKTLIRTSGRKAYLAAADRINRSRIHHYHSAISRVSSYCRKTGCAVAIGSHNAFQKNYFTPIINGFVDKGVPFLFICETPGAQKEAELIQEDGYLILKIKFPTSRELLSNRRDRTNVKTDFEYLKKKVQASSLSKNYKVFIIRRLKKQIIRYHKIRFFIDEFMKRIDVKFAFALPDRFSFQRAMLMMCKKKKIPTFTYDPFFNISDTVLAWYYFSDWALLVNRRYVKMLEENGFSRDRMRQVGSTLADYHMNNRSGAGRFEGIVNILLVTKLSRRTALNNDVIIDEILSTLENLDVDYALHIKPHPSDNDLYLRYRGKRRRGKVSILDRTTALRSVVPEMHILLASGISAAIFECLPSGKPIAALELTSTIDKSVFSRNDIKEVVPLFQNLDDFKLYLTDLVNDVSRNRKRTGRIPESVIDDFYFSLDGRTKDRIVDFVLSKTSGTQTL